MKTFLSKTLLAGTVFLLTINSTPTNNSKNKALYFAEARAKTVLSGIPNLSTAQGISEFIRYNYYAFNGAADDYEIQQGLGYLEVLNNILGTYGLGAVLGQRGYASCSSIPTSGSTSGTVSKGPMSMNVSLTFGTAKKKIPSHFPYKANANFSKSVKITAPGMGTFYVELECSNANIDTAYVYSVNDGGDFGATVNEAFYQKDSSTNAVYVDFYMEDSSNINVNRFVTDDGDKFSLYHFSYASNRGEGFAITGYANGKANINAVTVNGLTGDVAAKDIFDDLSASANSSSQTVVIDCIDMATNATDTGCPTLEPTTAVAIDSTSFDWTFNSMSTFTTSTSPF